jgi:glycerate-2-kinase
LDYRALAVDVFKIALGKIAPERIVSDKIRFSGNRLSVMNQLLDLDDYENLYVVAIGKAAHPLAVGLHRILGDAVTSGLVLSNAFFGPLPDTYRCFKCTHPLPSSNNVEAAEAVIDLAGRTGEKDIVLCLVSGGGSAIFSSPVQGVSVDEKADTVNQLMLAGAAIDELNAVRKHISRVKGGRLLQALFPARVVALYLSDVPNDNLSVIASGPTAVDESTFADALSVIKKYGLENSIPGSIRDHLGKGLRGEVEETLKPGAIPVKSCTNILLGRNHDMLVALKDELRERGFWTVIEPRHFQGEARDYGMQLARKAIELNEKLPSRERPYAFLRGGETTVTVKGSGLGGRNTELALSAALALEGTKKCAILAAGTDGKDGPTNAAGAAVDGSTVLRMKNAGIDPHKMLKDNDSFNGLEPVGDVIITGHTGTNLMDVVMVLIGNA